MGKLKRDSFKNGQELVEHINQHHHIELSTYALGLSDDFNFDSAFVEDLLQDFYLKVLLKWKTFNDGYVTLGIKYLTVALRNEVNDQRRKMQARRRREKLYGEARTQFVSIFNLCQDLIQKKHYDLMEKFLTKKEFDTFELWLTGHSYREISELLNIPQGTVSSRITSAKRKLSNHI